MSHKSFAELMAESVNEVETLSEKEIDGLAGVLGIKIPADADRDGKIAAIKGTVKNEDSSSAERLRGSISMVKKPSFVGRPSTSRPNRPPPPRGTSVSSASGSPRPARPPERPPVRPPKSDAVKSSAPPDESTQATPASPIATPRNPPPRPKSEAPTRLRPSGYDNDPGSQHTSEGGGGDTPAIDPYGSDEDGDEDNGEDAESSTAVNRTSTIDITSGAAAFSSPNTTRRSEKKWFSVKKSAKNNAKAYIDEMDNPLAKKSETTATAVSKAPIIPQSGVKTGDLELSNNQLASVMDDLLRDIATGKDKKTTEGGDKTLDNALKVAAIREKLPGTIRRKNVHSMEIDMSKRATVIPPEYEYVANERDFESTVTAEELKDLELKANEASPEEYIPKIPADLTLSVTLLEYTAGDTDDDIKLILKCGDLTWDVERTLSEAAEVRDNLKEDAHLSELAELLPERGDAPINMKASMKKKNTTKESDSAVALRKKNFDTWVKKLVENISTEQAQKLDYLDEFFETFWNIEEARKQAPEQIDYMAHKHLTRETSEVLLKQKSPGTYLVRKKAQRGANDGELVISCVHDDGSFWHGIVDKTKSRKPWTLRGTNKNHESLDALITFYSKEAYSKSHGKEWVLGAFCPIKMPDTAS